jgi:hypothetical protein
MTYHGNVRWQLQMTTIEQLANALGLWPGTQWLLTLLPAPHLAFVPLAVTLGLWLFLKTCVELRRPQFGKQYKGLIPGDVFLSFAVGILMTGLAFYATPKLIGGFWRSPLWDALTILVILVIVLGLAWSEYKVAITDPNNPRSYTLTQLHSPTCLGHRVSMLFMTYLIMKVAIPALFIGAVPPLVKILAILGFLAWVYCVFLDNTRLRPYDLDAIHPEERAWFRIGRPRPKLNAAPASPNKDTRYDALPPRWFDDSTSSYDNGGYDERTSPYDPPAHRWDETVIDAAPVETTGKVYGSPLRLDEPKSAFVWPTEEQPPAPQTAATPTAPKRSAKPKPRYDDLSGTTGSRRPPTGRTRPGGYDKI